jgi:hypothetical protein
MLCSVSQSQVRKIGQAFKHYAHIEMRGQLSYFETKNFIASCPELLPEFLLPSFRLILFDYLLNMSLDVSLLVGQAVILATTVLQLRLALVLPVELEIDVAAGSSDRESAISKFNNL